MPGSAHALQRMSGRDPRQRHRAATTLELLFDLTFVIAYGTAASELAHALAEGHVGSGLVAFSFAVFAVSWAWIQFSWFASAYDTDDWLYRLLTLLQMGGVIVLALGVPRAFESLSNGEHLDNQGMVVGYVIMRIPMVFQWARAARQHPDKRTVCLTYIATILTSQVLWVALVLANPPVVATMVCVAILVIIEVLGPVLGEHRNGGTPWHPHHIAERYGLLVIIALGEGLIGTVASLQALLHIDSWSIEVFVLGLTGVAIPFGMWWMYFAIPFGPLIDRHPVRSFGWGYGHIAIFGATVAVGAGLHVVAYDLEHHSELTHAAAAATVAIPLGVFVVGLFTLYATLTRTMHPLHLVLMAVSLACLTMGVALAAAGVPLVYAIAAVAITPWVTVVGYERRGHLHLRSDLDDPASHRPPARSGG